MNRRPLLAALFTLLMPTLATADDAVPMPPPLTSLKPFTASYEVRLNNLPFKAEAQQSLISLGGDRWRIELKLKSFLLDTVERSDFRWDGANCHAIPGEYQYTRKGVGRDRQTKQTFDHAKKIATRVGGKQPISFAITDQTEDKLGHGLALACRIARGARGNVAVEVAWEKSVQHFDYFVSPDEEMVNTPAGNWRTLRFERKRVDSDRITRSWISPAANWQAVKMQHTEGDGNLLQLRLLELSP